jgi:dienelactone hydrolase
MKTTFDHETEVAISAGRVELQGTLTVPEHAEGVVLFAHGSGSSRHSPRNRFVASILNESHLATLLMDLLSVQEETIDTYTAELRFDISLLAERLESAIDWLCKQQETHDLEIGCFGSSTGAAAALVAASEKPAVVKAVVSRGGRPDLAGSGLQKVRAPTLMIVGGNDEQVIDLNKQAQSQMSAETKLEIIPGATHLFEEPGALEKVAHFAAGWFHNYLAS